MGAYLSACAAKRTRTGIGVVTTTMCGGVFIEDAQKILRV